MAKRTVLIAAPKPLVEALSMECVRASQTTYLGIFIELIETDCARLQSVCSYHLLYPIPTILDLSSIASQDISPSVWLASRKMIQS